MDNAKVMLIIPAWNEEHIILSIVQQASVLKRAGAISDFAVIDDGSTDRTVELVRKAGASVISLPNHSGKGQAYLEGMLHCKRSGAGVFASIDADVVQGVTPAHFEFLKSELESPMPDGRRTDMAIYPTTHAKGKNNYDSEATDNSGFRAIRIEALNFLFSKQDGQWIFSGAPLARRFMDSCQGFKLEPELNRFFRKSTKLLHDLKGAVLCLPTFRDSPERRETYYSDVKDHTLQLFTRRNAVQQKLKEHQELRKAFRIV